MGLYDPSVVVRHGAAECTVRPLVGIGFNPSLIAAPASLVHAAEAAGVRGVRFLGTTRVNSDNTRVDCANPVVKRRGGAAWEVRRRLNLSASDVVLLDRELRPLARAPIQGGACLSDPFALIDMRLVEANGSVLASYNVYASPDGDTPPLCTGNWLSTLDVSVRGPPPFAAALAPLPMATWQLTAAVRGSDDVGGSGLNGTVGVRLAAERNAGIVIASGEARAELVNSFPTLLFAWPSGERGRVADAVPPSFSAATHNNIHPLWLPELNAYLAVAHRHVHGVSNVSGAAEGPFQWGYGYRHTLYTLTPTLRVSRYSAELCLPAVTAPDGSSPPLGDAACEGVQFVMGALRVPEGVMLTYGVQDCESAAATFAIAELERLLRFDALQQEVRRA